MNLESWLGVDVSRWLAVPRPNWDRLATSAASALPESKVWRLFERAVAGLSVALCLHRVSPSRRDALTISELELDRFIARVGELGRSEERPWLTLSFDDGYADAARYIESRAPRHPDIEWLLMVCPEKAELQAAFRWELPSSDEADPRDPRRENARADLRALARRDHHIATLDQCRRVAGLANAALGNHTNCHFRAADLPFARAAVELERSHEHFRRLFGEVRHFAFPFGHPGRDFDHRHVEVLRRRGEFIIWTTARRPYLAADRRPGAVLPRFPVDGSWSATQLAFWIALLSLRARSRGLELGQQQPTPLQASRRADAAAGEGSHAP